MLLLWEAGVALGLVGKVAFAFEAAGSESGKGVEHAQEVERIEFDGLTERVGGESVVKHLVDLVAEEFWRSCDGVAAGFKIAICGLGPPPLLNVSDNW